MRPHLLLALCIVLSSTGDAYAGKTKRLYKHMAQGEYREALRKGAAYLDTDKVRPDAKEVRLIMARAAYFIATENNTVRAYETYLRKFPRSAYDARVKEQLAQLEYDLLVEGEPSVDRLRTFQSAYPNSTWVPDVRSREEETAWTATRADGSVEAIQAYKNQYPEGLFTRAAIEEEASRAYRAVQQADDLNAYIGFLQQYPGTRFTAEARSRSEELSWGKAERLNNIEGYKAFRNTFKDGPRVAEAYEREVALSWADTKGQHKIPNYREFGRDYASHDFALAAEDREWDLYHYKRDAYPGELVPQVTRTVREEDGSYRLFLSVLDQSDRYVGGLSADNFQVYDSGFQAQLLSLEGMEANRPVDIVFALDTTGSMAAEIEGVKRGIIRFADIMQLRSRDAQYGLVTFGDEVRSIHPFTKRVKTFQTWVGNATAEGGGDNNENPLDAMANALNFRRRGDAQQIFVLVTDAGGHERNHVTRLTFSKLTRILSDRDVQVYVVGPRKRDYTTMTRDTHGEHYKLNEDRFDETMELITQKVSKQYRLRYRRPPEAPPVVDDLNVRIRINREHAWVHKAGSGSSPGVGTTLVAISPHDSKNVFRGLTTGGLECSDDGGSTWQTCGAGLPFDSPVADLLVDDKHPEKIWVRTEDGRVWRSDDNATNFEDASVNGQPVISLVKHPTTAGALMASDGRQLWKKEDDREWEPASYWKSTAPISLMAAATGDSGTLLMLQEDGTLLRSTDGGDDYETIPNLPWDEKTVPEGIEFHPARDGLVMAYGGNRIHRSLDDGATWRPVEVAAPEADSKPMEIRDLVFDPTVRQMHLLTTSGGVYASKDLGKTWTPSNVGMAGRSSPSSAAVGPDGRVLLGMADTDAVYSMDPVANREFVFSNVYFDSGATKPRRALIPHLHDVAALLRSNPDMQLLVEGHADNLGSKETNLKISQGRAEWVTKFLNDKGVPSSRVAAAWFGEDRPLVSNDSRANRSKNRRVELVLIDDHKSIPTMDKMR